MQLNHQTKAAKARFFYNAPLLGKLPTLAQTGIFIAANEDNNDVLQKEEKTYNYLKLVSQVRVYTLPLCYLIQAEFMGSSSDCML